jgi:hypothetical protein
MRERIIGNIKSKISSEVKREEKNIPVSFSNFLSTDNTTLAGYLAPTPSSFILLNLGERENTA